MTSPLLDCVWIWLDSHNCRAEELGQRLGFYDDAEAEAEKGGEDGSSQPCCPDSLSSTGPLVGWCAPSSQLIGSW